MSFEDVDKEALHDFFADPPDDDSPTAAELENERETTLSDMINAHRCPYCHQPLRDGSVVWLDHQAVCPNLNEWRERLTRMGAISDGPDDEPF